MTILIQVGINSRLGHNITIQADTTYNPKYEIEIAWGHNCVTGT